MGSKRKYCVIIGSKAFFDRNLPGVSEGEELLTFLELVKLSDASRQARTQFDITVSKLFVKNNDYHGIVEAAHDRLGSLIEEFTSNDAEIYIHNPPHTLMEYLNDKNSRDLITMRVVKEEYQIQNDPKVFSRKIQNISSRIIGQDVAIEEISKSLWYLTNVKRTTPYVIMLYGNSSLGKTELVREIATQFFDGKCLEKHLSMFKNNNYADYFFGDVPNRRSIGFDLLERESNLIFLDELDKCPEHFYSAFYTLFDNVCFKDATYDVDISGLVIVLTSNFHTEEEMKKQLGLPIFYRIDKFIHFNDFGKETIYQIVRNEIKAREPEYIGKLTEELVYAAVSSYILTSGENARTIKYKVQKVIEELLFQEVISNENTPQ